MNGWSEFSMSRNSCLAASFASNAVVGFWLGSPAASSNAETASESFCVTSRSDSESRLKTAANFPKVSAVESGAR